MAIGVTHADQSNVGRWGKDKHCRGNTWFMPYTTIQYRDRDRPHPATFPLELPRRCLKLHGLDRIKLVLDPFAGIGTTLEAAGELGLDAIGYETSEEYVRSAMALCKHVTSEANVVFTEMESNTDEDRSGSQAQRLEDSLPVS